MVPLVIGVYIGMKKPASFKSFFTPFFEDFHQLEDSFTVNGRTFHLEQRIQWIFDLPCWADMAAIKNGGYCGCPKCSTPGEFFGEGKSTIVHFPNKGKLRTHRNFVNRKDAPHHKGTEASVLEANGVDMIEHIPWDSMHATDLGVLYIIARSFATKLKSDYPGMGNADLTRMEATMAAARQHQPSEFGRKFQPLSRHAYWKSSEHRNFGLFLLPIISLPLKSLEATIPAYKIFIKLFVSLRLLAYEPYASNPAWVDQAEVWLEEIVREFTDYFGPERVTLKIHSLYHIANDVRIWREPLYAHSAYGFETNIRRVKKKISAPSFPLSQIHRRIVETANVNQILQKVKRAPLQFYKLEPGSDDICKYVRFRGAVISRDLKDSTFKLYTGEIIKVHRVKLSPEKEAIIEAQVISDQRALFNSTLDSRELEIFRSSLEVEPRKVSIRPADIEHKFFVMPIRDGDYGLLPMSRIGGDNFDSM